MTIHDERRIRLAVDCECGTTVEGCTEDELFDELLEHIAGVHEAAMRAAPAALVAGAYDAGR